MYKLHCIVLILVGLGVTMTLPLSAVAGVVYSCGFEPEEGYSPGNLDGQGPWSGITWTPPTVVQSSIVYEGQQAVQATADGDYNESFWWKLGSDALATTATDVTVSQHLMISHTGEADWLLNLSSDASDTAQIIFTWEGYVFVGSGGTASYAGTWTAGTWYELTFDLDYASGTFDVDLGGGRIASNVAMNSTAPLTGLDIYSDEWIETVASSIYYDSLVVSTPDPPIPGDTNNDHQVNQADAATMAGNWGLQMAGGSTVGDFNGDGWVNMLDASILAANWTGSQPEQAAVPEPGVATLLVAGLMALALRGRRR